MKRPVGRHERIVSGSWLVAGSISISLTLAQEREWIRTAGVRISGHAGPGDLDLTRGPGRVRRARRCRPESYRWSYYRDWDHVRLIVVDSRARPRARTRGQRGLLDPRGARVAGRADARRFPPPADRHVTALPAAPWACTTWNPGTKFSPRANEDAAKGMARRTVAPGLGP